MPVSLLPRPSDFASAGYEKEGYLVVRAAFSASEVEQVRGFVEGIADPTTLRSPEGPRRYDDDTARDRGVCLLSRVEYFRNTHLGLRAMAQDPRLLGIASLLLGEPAVLFKDKVNFKRPGSSGFDPHQDAQAGWERYAVSFVTVLVSLDAATVENGCLEIAPGRHREGLLGPLLAPISPALAESLRFEPLPTAPGDVVFFGARTPHRSASNCTDESRRVLYLTYNGLSGGDQYERYFADKLAAYPPDDLRVPGSLHRYKV